MTDAWTERLSEYLDGELTAAESAELERHVDTCESCRQHLRELGTVVARLRNDPLRPEDQPTLLEWRSIQEAIGGRRRRWFGRAAIAAALAGLAAAAGVWRSHSGEPAPDRLLNRVLAADYRQASADLEAVLKAQRSRLQPETIRAVEASLATIDSAIAQASRALAADPANEYV